MNEPRRRNASRPLRRASVAQRIRTVWVVVGALLAVAVAPSARAFAPFVVKDIRVEGVQRTEAGT
ncbi:MAG TPA: hypothetical protein VF959_04735, partial [Casimicrobiaceae bacterium]